MVQVEVSEGILEGEEVQNEYGGTYYSFKGIPYAQPPLGDLRFKAPQPVQPWTGVRNATKFGPICCQYDIWQPKENLYEYKIEMSEDCLFLNIYTPNIRPSKLLPVMVYIHGGGNTCGSGNDDYYGPQFLIRHGVILVTFNYRLEALGFLCLHTAELPGNAGYKDQVAVLRWLNKNIGYFGGDPRNVTIFGESSGGTSVSLHLVSPMTKGLFRRAICQSGAATGYYNEEFELREKAILLARQLGCVSEDNKTLYEYFKNVPVKSLYNLKLRIWKAQKPIEDFFTVANERDFGQERFFYGSIMDALKTNVHEGVELMTGYNKDDYLLALSLGHSLEHMVNEIRLFNEFLVPGWIRYNCVIADQLEVGRKLRQYYFKDGDITKERVMRFLNMEIFTYAVTLLAKHVSSNNKVFFYKFACLTERNIFARVDLPEPIEDDTVVCHGDDLAYLFPLKVILNKIDEESETFKAVNKVTTLWTNFAKYGNPTPTLDLGVEWKPYTVENEECLDLGNTLTMGTAPEKQEVDFWESIFKEYLPKYTFN